MAKVCTSCQNPLRIISGGNKIKDSKIVNIQVLGCMNPECSLKMQEQDRVEKEVPSFEG
jgi:LSD1 subclass zinc finger protein